MKKSKSQLIGTAFVYLFSAVVIALILILGYKYIHSTKEIISTTELNLLKNKIASDIKTISSDYGSSKKVSYSIPESAELCLFDLNKKEEILNDALMGSKPLIKNSLESDASRNAFLVGRLIFEPFYVGDIEIKEPYFYCLKPVAGKVSFVIEGLGNRTLVSAVN